MYGEVGWIGSAVAGEGVGMVCCMCRTLVGSFVTAVGSSMVRSIFVCTLAIQASAWLVGVTSVDARLSSLRPVHVLMLSSTNIDEEPMDGAVTVGSFVSAALTSVALFKCVMSFSCVTLS